MIMPRGQQLLLPANPIFIYLTLFFALLVMLLYVFGAWHPKSVARHGSEAARQRLGSG